MARARAPLRWRTLRRRRSTRASRAHASCRADRDRPCPMKRHRTGGSPRSFGATPWCNVPACFYVEKRERHCAGCLSGEGTERELNARTRRAALVESVHVLCTGTTPAGASSPSVQDLGKTCQLRAPMQSRLSRGTRARAPLRRLSLGRRDSMRASRARALCRAGCYPPMSYERAPHRRRPLSFGA